MSCIDLGLLIVLVSDSYRISLYKLPSLLKYSVIIYIVILGKKRVLTEMYKLNVSVFLRPVSRQEASLRVHRWWEGSCSIHQAKAFSDVTAMCQSPTPGFFFSLGKARPCSQHENQINEACPWWAPNCQALELACGRVFLPTGRKGIKDFGHSGDLLGGMFLETKPNAP